MKNILILFVIVVSLIFASCSNDIADLNIDPKAATAVEPEVLFSYATENLARQMNEIEYNYNLDRFWANYLTQTTYINECTYDPKNRDIGGSLFDNIYTEVLMELKSARELIEAVEVSDALLPVKNNKLAMITILEAYSYQYLVDNFGDVPFTEALDISNITPAYDDAATIYSTISSNLSAALDNMDVTEDGFETSADLLYDGDVAGWYAFGNSLLLKIGMRLADVNSTAASQLVSNAITNGVFTSNADNAAFSYLASDPYTNPCYNYIITDGRATDFIASDFFIDLLNTYNDPRIVYYFDDNVTPYIGGPYGGIGNTYENFSHVSPTILAADYPGILMDYSAVAFYLAEAVERGFISGDAETYYIDGITASFEFWGLTAGDLSSYLAEPNVVYNPANYKESIGIQKYIASYNQGHEGWTEARRLDYPVLVAAASNGEANPRRLLYPNSEVLINKANYDAASAAIGGDVLETQLFWDIY